LRTIGWRFAVASFALKVMLVELQADHRFTMTESGLDGLRLGYRASGAPALASLSQKPL